MPGLTQEVSIFIKLKINGLNRNKIGLFLIHFIAKIFKIEIEDIQLL